MANSSIPERSKVTRVCRCAKIERSDSKGGKTRAVYLNDLKWEHGRQITVSFFEGGNYLWDDKMTFSERKQFVMDTINRTIVPLVNLQFLWSDDNDSTASVRITFDSREGAWSYVGKDCLQVESDAATMNLGWLDHPSENGLSNEGSVIVHEFGHVLGLVHEHQSKNFPYIWNRDAVYEELQGDPNNWSEDMIDENIFKIFDSSNSVASGYDPHSIMHYYFPSRFFLDPNIVIPYNRSLSVTDVKTIQDMYPVTYGCGSSTTSEERIRVNSGIEPFTVLLIMLVILILGIGLSRVYRHQRARNREMRLTVISYEPGLRGTIQ